ncbi:MAG: class I SAM-dependent methyltransferase [Candidatus Eisenbacteria bacterium]|uniref:Class I SAM-dependent methyltransferase n=1 Tax=Eiseniibacteriota bacterium TaxID=2212470 RepID=A0A948W4U9_UNCEI|nr:class I SAM-dependent methyltransferase [Candidatus Eisenbacteria bacterium]MBU1949494.1 class I SAM-dependent methyltransferase [Candidatus Eisenbacteria bacterium]MBU2689724.1 class I SAM-dependent methyltransferase [Candidatus Eisenbacteria bacterium]
MERLEYHRMFEAEESFWWYRSLRRTMLTLLDPYLPEEGGWRILDAGCGTGGFLIKLSHWGRIIGMDVAPLALELAKRRGSWDLIQGGVQSVPVASESMDLVVSMDVLYHKEVPDDREALAELVRCLRPGGWLCLNLPAFNWLKSSHDIAIHTARRYTRKDLSDLLSSQPLHVHRLTHWNMFLFPLAVMVRLLRTTRHEDSSDVRPLPQLLNNTLESILKIESKILARADLPIGLSVAAVAQKLPAGGTRS